ncbi:MAG: hypothetical protein ACRDJW_08325 [Thermomicrobiales bacterium]
MQPPTDAGLTNELMRRLARRLEANPDFLAAVFRRYRDAQDLDDDRIAFRLGVAPDDLPRLAICKRPRHDQTDPTLFRADVETIAEEFGLNPFTLAEVVRSVDVLDAVAGAPPGAVEAGFLAAAKERAAEERADYDAGADDDDDRDPGDDR